MKKFVFLIGTALLLASCVDTTGLTGTIHSDPYPKSNPAGAATVMEFADLQCPACRTAHAAIVQPLLATRGTTIRYEFHHFPLRSLHRFALDAAEAAECAGDQGKFWEYVDRTYEEQDKLSTSIFAAWAKELSLDADLFERCTQSHIKRDAILESYSVGQELGVAGTPTFFVNGRRVESTLDAITKEIDAVVQAAGRRM